MKQLFYLEKILSQNICQSLSVGSGFTGFSSAKTWLRLSGIKVVVSGKENLQKNQSYVFVANHHSYLDTAAMFAYTGKKMGVIAQEKGNGKWKMDN